jgi:tRNA (cytidine/uridine-2'-O-)-methyltransferase
MDVVLVEPEIPQNTGSIARTCAATNTPLHLVGKLGFKITEKAVRRAGLDYWPFVDLHTHDCWDDYIAQSNPGRIWLLSKFGEKTYHSVCFKDSDAIVFGSETRGLGQEFLSRFSKEQILRIPISRPEVRSLNLSNAVSIVLYEAKRQLGFSDFTER